ncbi:MAG: hypothetical protein AAF602_14095 [Myxococcota bacterium]
MSFGSAGLTAIPDKVLVELLRQIHRGAIVCPVTRRGLGEIGLLHWGDDLGHLRGLDKSGTVATLVAVLAERRNLQRGIRRSSEPG